MGPAPRAFLTTTANAGNATPKQTTTPPFLRPGRTASATAAILFRTRTRCVQGAVKLSVAPLDGGEMLLNSGKNPWRGFRYTENIFRFDNFEKTAHFRGIAARSGLLISLAAISSFYFYF